MTRYVKDIQNQSWHYRICVRTPRNPHQCGHGRSVGESATHCLSYYLMSGRNRFIVVIHLVLCVMVKKKQPVYNITAWPKPYLLDLKSDINSLSGLKQSVRILKINN